MHREAWLAISPGRLQRSKHDRVTKRLSIAQHKGLVVLSHVGSSKSGIKPIFCIGKWIFTTGPPGKPYFVAFKKLENIISFNSHNNLRIWVFMIIFIDNNENREIPSQRLLSYHARSKYILKFLSIYSTKNYQAMTK